MKSVVKIVFVNVYILGSCDSALINVWSAGDDHTFINVNSNQKGNWLEVYANERY